VGLVNDIAKASRAGLREAARWMSKSDDDVTDSDMGVALVKAGMADNQAADPTMEPPRALFHDPYSILDWGGWRQRPSALTYEALGQMATQVTPIAAIIQLRVNQISQFCRPQQGDYDKGYRVMLRDRRDKRSMTLAEKKMAREIERMLETTGYLLPTEKPTYRDSFRSFTKKSVRDILTFDQWAFEKQRDMKGRPSRFIALDGASIRPAVADVEHMSPEEHLERVAYVQVYENTVVAEYSPDDLAWCIMNPRSGIKVNGFGLSPIEQIVRLVTAWLYGFQYNLNFFSQGSAIKGLINIKGAIPDKQMRAFRRMWYTMISGTTNAWRTPILNSDDIQWVSMHSANREMEYSAWMDWLTKLICMPAGMRIQMADGTTKPVEDIQIDDLVMTHKGRARRVTKTMKNRHVGPLVRMRGAYGGDLLLTGNHPVFAVEGHYDTNTMERKFQSEARLVRADHFSYAATSLKRQDYVTIPRWDIPVDTVVLSFREPMSGIGKRVEDQQVDAEMARWLGLYAAEGCSSRKGDVLFCFHEKEEGLASFVKRVAVDRLGLVPCEQVDPERKSRVIRISSVLLAECLRDIFGVRATERKMTRLLAVQDDVLMSFLGGVFDGDGCALRAGRASSTMRITTASRTFADQLRFAIHRLVGPVGMREVRRSGGFGPPRPYYEVMISANKASAVFALSEKSVPSGGSKTSAHVTGGGWALRLRSYGETPPVDGWVYNFEVEEDHSYVAEGVAVHNCAVYGVDPTEINFQFGNTGQSNALNEGSQESKVIESKDKGLRPLTEHLTDHFNQHLIWELCEDFEFSFVGLDAKAEATARDARVKESSAFKTIDEVRAEVDLPALPEGKGAMIRDSTWVQFASGGGEQGGEPGEPGEGEDDLLSAAPGASADGDDEDEPDDLLSAASDASNSDWGAADEEDDLLAASLYSYRDELNKAERAITILEPTGGA